jgi:mono/diheme cytochrome c family protein
MGACLLLSGCDKVEVPKNASEATQTFNDLAKEADGFAKFIPGDPRNQHHWMPPEEVKDFKVLYSQNCQGCHSFGEGVSASIALDNPTYLSWIPKEKLRAVIADGVPHTPMPAWGKKGGGPLTDEQIDILVNGFMLKKPETVPPGLPPYEAALGNPQKGETLLNTVYGPEKAADWISPSFLALVSDQYLRTLLVVGRPELGQDMSKVHAGAPLSGEEISDVVAWLASKRPGAAQSTAPSDIQTAVPTNAAPVIKPKGGL